MKQGIKFLSIILFIFFAGPVNAAVKGREATQEEMQRFDDFFQKYVTAHRERNAAVLVNTFGSAGTTSDNIKDSPAWHFSAYDLYRAVTSEETENEVKLKAWYIVSYGENDPRKSVMNVYGKFNRSEDNAYMFSWQIYPMQDNPEIFENGEAAQQLIDDFISHAIQINLGPAFRRAVGE